MYTIETTRLGLRNWDDKDLADFVDLNKDPAVMEFFPRPLSEHETREMLERLRSQIMNRGFGFWPVEIKDTREFIGFVGLSVPRFEAVFTPCIEIGWRLACRYWGQGYATEAATACLNYGFSQLNLPEIVSFTSVLNSRSINVMKKIGMSYSTEFDHPGLEPGNILRKHVLYKIGLGIS